VCVSENRTRSRPVRAESPPPRTMPQEGAFGGKENARADADGGVRGSSRPDGFRSECTPELRFSSDDTVNHESLRKADLFPV